MKATNIFFFICLPGIKIGVALSRTHAFQKFNSRLHAIPIPGCEGHPMESDAYYTCLARHYTATIYHPCGTAKMGPYWDPEAVVDHELK